MVSDTVYSITQNEWKMLFALAGKKEIYGLFFEEDQPGERERLQILYEMSKKGMLEIRESCIYVSAMYKLLMERIENAPFGVQIQKRETDERQDVFLYPGERVVIVEPDIYKKKSFWVRDISFSALMNWIERDLIPDFQTREKSAPWEDAVEEKEYLEQQIHHGLFMKKIMPDGKEKQWLFQGEWKGKDWIFSFGDEKYCKTYAKKDFMDQVKMFMEVT